MTRDGRDRAWRRASEHKVAQVTRDQDYLDRPPWRIVCTEPGEYARVMSNAAMLWYLGVFTIAMVWSSHE